MRQHICHFEYFYRRNQASLRNFDELVTTWDGNEIRLVRLIAEILNFTLQIKESSDSK